MNYFPKHFYLPEWFEIFEVTGCKSSPWTNTKKTLDVSRVNKSDSLEGEGATVQLLGSAKTGLFGWGAAEQQELVGGVHEFELLW